MSGNTENYLKNCLFFTVNSLAREVTKLAEESFKKLGFSTSHAFLLMLVIENPGISQKKLSEDLHLAQSTVSRFVDSLVLKGLLNKTTKNKGVEVFPTKKGKEQLDNIGKVWKEFYENYSEILGKDEGDNLAKATYDAFLKLNK